MRVKWVDIGSASKKSVATTVVTDHTGTASVIQKIRQYGDVDKGAWTGMKRFVWVVASP